MTDDKREKIQSKIAKLLSLATSSNEHEAKLAMANAQKLMTKYNIDEADALVNITSNDITEECFEVKEGNASASIIARASGDLFDCRTIKTITRFRNRSTLTFIGTPENVKSAQALTHHLIASQKSIYRVDYKHHVATAYCVETKGIFFGGHIKGFASSIYKRVKVLLAEREQELKSESTNAGLVPIKTREAVNIYVNREYPNIRKVRACRARSYSGFEAGTASGNNVCFGQPITNASGAPN